MSKIERILKEAATPGFWGQVQIDYRNGEAVVVRKTETHNINTERNGENGREHGNNRY